MVKIMDIEKALTLVPHGATIMFGGFLGCGSAHQMIDALSKSEKENFTIICNDAAILNGPDGSEHYAIAKLIHNKQVKHLIASHVGLNPEVAAQVREGELKVTLIPQGSMAEMIRAGGAGLGGVLTPTGVGTILEDNSEIVYEKKRIDGVDYLLMKPLHADIAIINADQIDTNGNMWYKGTTRNFNPLMATAADLVIAEADHVVQVGIIEPENVITPGVFVDYIVRGGKQNG
ncbi:CoA transferase subunit A [Gottschalkiaceae bacterium SANA]|nr:CoA transferase subunit A [Gottschalkiaceae bacterium SANA]